ncbi:MAG: FRG domain-containing protein [Ilumatobacteraceae bacterium]
MFEDGCWADEILDGSAINRGPYLTNTIREHPQLMLPNEIRAWRRDELDRVSSAGWMEPAGGLRMWGGPGSEPYFHFGIRPRQVKLPPTTPRCELPLSAGDEVDALLRGDAFYYLGELFLLPARWDLGERVMYHSDVVGRFEVVIAYRGQSRSFETVLTPGVLRGEEDADGYFRDYKAAEAYACNLLRQEYFEQRGDSLYEIQARGILQHHSVLATDLLDMTWRPSVAMDFALFEPGADGFSLRSWDDPGPSTVYEIVLRVAGSGADPPPGLTLNGLPLTSLPFNIYELDMVTDHAFDEAAIGVSHLGRNDWDAYGTVLNVTAHEYHEVSNPRGWESLVDQHDRRAGGRLVDCRALPDAEWQGSLMVAIVERLEARLNFRRHSYR